MVKDSRLHEHRPDQSEPSKCVAKIDLDTRIDETDTLAIWREAFLPRRFPTQPQRLMSVCMETLRMPLTNSSFQTLWNLPNVVNPVTMIGFIPSEEAQMSNSYPKQSNPINFTPPYHEEAAQEREYL